MEGDLSASARWAISLIFSATTYMIICFLALNIFNTRMMFSPIIAVVTIFFMRIAVGKFIKSRFPES